MERHTFPATGSEFADSAVSNIAATFHKYLRKELAVFTLVLPRYITPQFWIRQKEALFFLNKDNGESRDHLTPQRSR